MSKPFPFPRVSVLGAEFDPIIVLGGAGVGIFGPRAVSTVMKRGLVGNLSSAGARRVVEAELGIEVSDREAVRFLVSEAKRLSNGMGLPSVNLMCQLETNEESILGAIEAFAGEGGSLFSGAGIPGALARIAGEANVGLVPIISSLRALELLLKLWDRVGRIPDAIVVEGRKAGGHLGFKGSQFDDPEYELERILVAILEFVSTHGGYPVIAAGGIWDRQDILKMLRIGVQGVQVATRFVATIESDATQEYKQAYVDCQESDIIVVDGEGPGGSPSGLPIRILRNSPGYLQALAGTRPAKCWGYMMHKGVCLFQSQPDKTCCICNTLFKGRGVNPDPNVGALFTCGSNAYRVKEILPMNTVIDELTGYPA